MLLLALLAASGCVEQPASPSPGLKISIDAPSEVYKNERFTVYADVENYGNDTYEVEVDFFDTGVFSKSGSCRESFTLKENEVRIIPCELVYQGELEKETESKISTRISYRTSVEFVQPIEFLSQEEYEQRKIKGTYRELPTRFLYNNGDVEIEIETSENPVVKVKERKHYVYVKIRNVGEGMISKIEDIKITTTPPNLLACDIPPLVQQEGRFPTIACSLDVSNLKENFLNIFLQIYLSYNYEIKKVVTVRVVK